MIDYKIHTIDLNFQGATDCIASYLVEGAAGMALIETGPGSTLSRLRERLSELGFRPKDIQHVLVTHIHFDHAGAAGWWAQQGATVYVHYFGAKHLINPERLIASASRIYGDQMDSLWGDILAAPAEKVVALNDGDRVEVGDLVFEVIETPGHASHHHVFQLGDIAFTGDTAGMKLGQLPLLDIPAPPPEFDLEDWQASIDKLLTRDFRRIYPTHFGEVTNVTNHLNNIRQLVAECAGFVKEKMDAGMERDDLVQAYASWNHGRAHALNLSAADIHKYNIANPLYMSVDGIMRYWRKKEKMP